MCAGTKLQLKVAISSGEPLPVSVLRGMRETLPENVRILNLYGSTEVAADCTFLDAGAWLDQLPQQAPVPTLVHAFQLHAADPAPAAGLACKPMHTNSTIAKRPQCCNRAITFPVALAAVADNVTGMLVEP